MGLKDILAKISGGSSEKNEKFKEMEQEFMLRKKLEEKQKSSNERELERYIKEQREARIKLELQKFRDKQKKETWKSNTMLTKGSPILKNERPILQEPDVIGLMKHEHRNKSTMLNNRKGMFFK